MSDTINISIQENNDMINIKIVDGTETVNITVDENNIIDGGTP